MWVLLAILAVPLIEIGLFVTLGGAIGLWATLAWVLISAALGLVVLKGIATTGSVTLGRDMHELADPLSPIAHRVMVVMAGGLLLLPGFFTDALGLLLLIRPVRALAIRAMAGHFGDVVSVWPGAAGRRPGDDAIDGTFIDLDAKPPRQGRDGPPSGWTRH